MLSKELTDVLIKFASQPVLSDDDQYPDFGGNVDDAYSMGMDAGLASISREVLKELGIEFKIRE